MGKICITFRLSSLSGRLSGGTVTGSANGEVLHGNPGISGKKLHALTVSGISQMQTQSQLSSRCENLVHDASM